MKCGHRKKKQEKSIGFDWPNIIAQLNVLTFFKGSVI